MRERERERERGGGGGRRGGVREEEVSEKTTIHAMIVARH